MRKYQAIIIFILCTLLALTPAALAAGTNSKGLISKSTRIPGHAFIPAGTMIACELVTGLNSGRNSTGDSVMFKTTEAVVINGVTVIPVGAAGQAVVSNIRKAGSFGRGGRVTISTRSVKAINGADIPVRFDLSKSGGNEGWVIPAFLFVSILAGFAKGKNQDLPAGTRFNVAVESDYDLGVEVERLSEVMVDPNKPQAKPKPAIPPEIMTIHQAADYLQVPANTVWQMMQDGRIKYIMLGNQYRIRKADLDNIK